MGSHARQQGLTFPDGSAERDTGCGSDACEGDTASTVSYAGDSGTQDELFDGEEDGDDDDEGLFDP